MGYVVKVVNNGGLSYVRGVRKNSAKVLTNLDAVVLLVKKKVTVSPKVLKGIYNALSEVGLLDKANLWSEDDAKLDFKVELNKHFPEEFKLVDVESGSDLNSYLKARGFTFDGDVSSGRVYKFSNGIRLLLNNWDSQAGIKRWVFAMGEFMSRLQEFSYLDEFVSFFKLKTSRCMYLNVRSANQIDLVHSNGRVLCTFRLSYEGILQATFEEHYAVESELFGSPTYATGTFGRRKDVEVGVSIVSVIVAFNRDFERFKERLFV